MKAKPAKPKSADTVKPPTRAAAAKTKAKSVSAQATGAQTAEQAAGPAAQGGLIRDRIKELRRVPAGELRANPRNWRTHPQAQRDALRGILAEVGMADAMIARETPEGLELIDGHLRTDVLADQIVPVLVLDVTEAEANKLLVTLDPLAAMAQADAANLDAILRDVQTGSEALAAMLTELAKDAAIIPADAGDASDDAEIPEGNYQQQFGVIVICADEPAQQLAYEELKSAGYNCKVVTT